MPNSGAQTASIIIGILIVVAIIALIIYAARGAFGPGANDNNTNNANNDNSLNVNNGNANGNANSNGNGNGNVNSNTNGNSNGNANSNGNSNSNSNGNSNSNSNSPVTRNFTIIASNYSYSPSTITVKRGETVKITVQNTNGTHDLVIDEYDVDTSLLNAGGQTTVTFIADRAGTFEYYCSVGNHRAMGMRGNLIVE